MGRWIMADRHFSDRAYGLLDTSRSFAEAGKGEMDAVVVKLCAEIAAGEWGFFARRGARSELAALVQNCRANADMAAGWADQTGDQQLRAQSACFLRMAQQLDRISI